MRTCSCCKVCKEPEHFHRDRSKADGLYYWCKDCVKTVQYARRRADPSQVEKAKAYSRNYRRENPEKNRRIIRNSTLKKKYGITAKEFDILFDFQGSCCAICKDTESKGNGSFHVDHCHKSGKIRGILCQACNVTLGKMRDDPALLRAAANYLEER